MKPLSKTELKEAFPQYTEYRIRTIIESLIKKGRVVSVGKGKATRYIMNFTNREAKWNLQRMLFQLSDFINKMP